jgi:hypothetical protein
MRDFSQITVKKVLAPGAAVTDNTAQVGTVIDHQGFDKAMYVINTGTLSDADATFTVLLEESDASGSGFAAVADDDMVSQTAGTAPEAAASFQFDDDGEVRKLIYIGAKRYTRLTITPANNTGNMFVSSMCLLGGPNPANTQLAQPAS